LARAAHREPRMLPKRSPLPLLRHAVPPPKAMYTPCQESELEDVAQEVAPEEAMFLRTLIETPRPSVRGSFCGRSMGSCGCGGLSRCSPGLCSNHQLWTRHACRLAVAATGLLVLAVVAVATLPRQSTPVLNTPGFGGKGPILELYDVEAYADSYVALNHNEPGPNYSEVFPEESRSGRLSHHHRTVTMGGFRRAELNARYTERFGDEYLVNGRETYWTVDLAYFLYWCDWVEQWIIGFNFESVRGGRCDYTATGPHGVDILDPFKPKGWSEFTGSRGLVKAPQAGVDILSTQAWLHSYVSSGVQHDSLDMHAECKRPPYDPINYTRVYKHLLTRREELTSNTNYNQGTCRNCWAITVAELVARLLCITSARNWVGPRAMISPAYITSCAKDALVNPDDGCHGGGRPLQALWWIGQNGVPTGGDNSSDQTCVPFFHTNRTGVTHAPACPTSCTNPQYPRSLQQDLFIPEGLKHSFQTTALESALKAMRHAPIAIIIPLFEDFYNYTGGVYVHKTGKRLGNHVMVAHGFEGGHISGFNSWGPGWGYFGNYRVPMSFPIAFIIPGKFRAVGDGYPYPFPKSITTMSLGGFDNPELNGEYSLWVHELADINGHTTFWKGDDLVMYWCSVSRFWAIAKVDVFIKDSEDPWSRGWRQEMGREVVKVRQTLADDCEWLAHGPQLFGYHSLPGMPEAFLLGWYERADNGVDMLKPMAGIRARF